MKTISPNRPPDYDTEPEEALNFKQTLYAKFREVLNFSSLPYSQRIALIRDFNEKMHIKTLKNEYLILSDFFEQLDPSLNIDNETLLLLFNTAIHKDNSAEANLVLYGVINFINGVDIKKIPTINTEFTKIEAEKSYAILTQIIKTPESFKYFRVQMINSIPQDQQHNIIDAHRAHKKLWVVEDLEQHEDISIPEG